MSAKTKIWVLHMREVILTAIFMTLAVLLLVFIAVSLSSSGNKSTDAPQSELPKTTTTPVTSEAVINTSSTEKYVPGIYRTVLYLNDQTVDIEVTVDATQITSLALTNMDDNMNTMYPLLAPTFENIKEQLYTAQSPELVSIASERKYTSLLLLEAIAKALEKAALP